MRGWECPGCGRCYAPIVLECGVCGPKTKTVATDTVTFPNITIWVTCNQCGQTHQGGHVCAVDTPNMLRGGDPSDDSRQGSKP